MAFFVKKVSQMYQEGLSVIEPSVIEAFEAFKNAHNRSQISNQAAARSGSIQCQRFNGQQSCHVAESRGSMQRVTFICNTIHFLPPFS